MLARGLSCNDPDITHGARYCDPDMNKGFPDARPRVDQEEPENTTHTTLLHRFLVPALRECRVPRKVES